MSAARRDGHHFGRAAAECGSPARAGTFGVVVAFALGLAFLALGALVI
ncbi:hypothetical protein [Streptomyces sp. NBC_01481]|nr:hypothetical protein [Streptomyces sp. NBC_01481]MCX4586067.1 hypothetical protein [Streptomyces sp. NBC_01481]